MKRAGVIALALLAMHVTPAFADDTLMGPKTPDAAPAAEEPEAAPAPAAETEKPAAHPLELRPSRSSDAGPSGGYGIGLKLLAVAAVFAGAFLLFKRKNVLQAARATGNAPRIVSRTAIGMRNELLVVEVEGQKLLIGVTPSSIATLSVIVEEPKEMVEDIARTSRVELPSHRPAIHPPSPLGASSVEESLSRLIAGARAELDEQPTLRRALAPKPAPSQRSARAEKSDAAPASPKKTSSKLREVPSLEGQVRGLTAKRG